MKKKLKKFISKLRSDRNTLIKFIIGVVVGLICLILFTRGFFFRDFSGRKNKEKDAKQTQQASNANEPSEESKDFWDFLMTRPGQKPKDDSATRDTSGNGSGDSSSGSQGQKKPFSSYGSAIYTENGSDVAKLSDDQLSRLSALIKDAEFIMTPTMDHDVSEIPYAIKLYDSNGDYVGYIGADTDANLYISSDDFTYEATPKYDEFVNLVQEIR